MSNNNKQYPSVPRDKNNNYTESLAMQRRDFVNHDTL